MTSPMGSLVGRRAELAVIERTLEALDAQRPGSLTVEGEPGMGKTRLLAELRRRAEDRGHIVLHGAASEFETFVPFGVLVDAFDAYLATLTDEVAKWPTDLRSELGGVFPSLRVDGGSISGVAPDERYRTHRATRALIERLAAHQPLVLMVDDAHWADDASLELVQALLRTPPDAAALLVMGFRPGQAPPRLGLALAAPSVERIALGPLSRDEAAQLLATDVTAPLLTTIYEQGGGNPFYLQQLARAGGDGAAIVEVGGGAVPAGIAASVAEEVSALSPEAQLMIESAALVGDPFEPDVAAEIAGLEPNGALELLDELLTADLVRATSVPRRFRLRHPLVRRAVYEGSQMGWRIAAHGRAADALAARGADVTARAHHVEYAARRGDEEAIALLMAAGRASAVPAPVVAARWFEAAQRLLPASDTSRQVEVRREMAIVLRSAGQLEPCRTVLVDAIELISDPADPTRIDLTAQCAAVERWLDRDREAAGRLARAADLIPESDSGGRATLQIEMAVHGVFERNLGGAIASGENALVAARSTGSPSLIGAAASVLALAEAGAARIDVARNHREEARTAIDGLTDEDLGRHLDSLYHLGWAENYLEHFEDSLAHVDRLIRAARRGDGARPLVPMLLVKCYPLENLGRLSEAAELCEMAVEATQLDGAEHFLPWALFERGWAHYYMGELDAAVACAEESMRISHRKIGGAGPSAGVGPAWIIACAMLESGQPDRAAELLRPIVGDEIDGSMPVERGFFWEALALMEAGTGRLEQADAYVVRSEQDAESTGLAIPHGTALRARAQLTLTMGDPTGAAELAARSADAFASIGARIEVAFSQNLQGRALAEAGDREAAIPVLRGAEAELDACGSIRERDAARRALRGLGARREIRGPAAGAAIGLEALTDREREIAELVTDRHTNREVAGRLYLSQKTVESHLRNVFVKLGVASRVEVARMVERERDQR